MQDGGASSPGKQGGAPRSPRKGGQGIIAIDKDGRIALVNGMTEKLFGYKRVELLGRTMEVLLPEKLAERHAEYRTGYFSMPRNRPMGIGMDLAGRRKDGVEFPVEISLSHMRTKEGPLAVAFITDISQHKQMQQALQKARRAAVGGTDGRAFTTGYLRPGSSILRPPRPNGTRPLPRRRLSKYERQC